MSKAYIKEVFGEQWDDYQLAAVSHEFGGNKQFFEMLKEYDHQTLPLYSKYG
jgi:hypothetical protein